MKSCYRLKKNYQYNYIYKHSQSVADKNFVLLYCTGNKKQSQIGFSVSKKYGHAVRRNRIRRQMKAAVAPLMPRVKDGWNMILIPRKHEDYQFEQIVASVNSLFAKAGVTK